MASLLGPNSTSLLGIDIGTSSVTVLELGRSGDKYSVSAFGVERIPENAIDGKNIKNQDEVVKAIKSAVAQSGSKSKSAAICVHASSVITKLIQLEDGLSEDEAEELVMLEADKYIPYPIDEVSIDYDIIGSSSRGSNLQDVMLVASRTENVNALVDLIRESDLVVKVVDVESYAIERACHLVKPLLAHSGENSTIALFDIGDIFTQMTVLHDMRTVFSREVAFGGKQLTDDIAKHFQLSIQDARQSKITGDLPDTYQEDVLDPFLEMVVLQIRRALQFFYSTSQLSEVDQIVLSGGSAVLKGLADKISESIGVETIVVDPIAEMIIGKGVDEVAVRNMSPALMIATGLAMRAFE